VEEGDDPEELDSERKVVDLLVEQMECADYIVLNKKDKASAGTENSQKCSLSCVCRGNVLGR
jgi:G3E family GTPase